MQKILNFIYSLQISHKVLICMLGITTLALMMISFLSYQYFSSRFEVQAKNNADYTLKIASKSFNTEFNGILFATSRFLSTSKMLKTAKDIENNTKTEYIYNYVSLESDFTALIQSNDFINSAFMIDKSNHFYSTTAIGLRYDVSNYFDWDLSDVNGITWLSSRKNPISADTNIIPLIIPIAYEERMNTVIVTDNLNKATSVLIILLDVNKMNQYLSQINNNYGAVLYLTNNYGLPLSLNVNSTDYELSNNTTLIDKIQTSDTAISFDQKIGKDTYLVSSYTIGIQKLKLVSIVLRRDLLSGLDTIKSFIIFSWIICSGVAALLSIIVSKRITDPINLLVNVVEKIQDGCYDKKVQSKYYDEVGILNQSINEMYDTIQQQIELIKEDMQAKAKAEIDILTNQINPHFLYNTLECIHLEILANHIEDASSMVESLGQFLRIGLNHGRNLIPIHQELTHAEQYINIMNHRSNNKIDFHYFVEPELENHEILKLILQPLVENSIKHGFQSNAIKQNIFSQFIDVKINKNTAHIVITVTDNGIGIDIEKAKAALYQVNSLQSLSQIGLNNIYRRLRVYYGEDVDIQFFSIPFCQNSVTITIPSFLEK